MHPLEGFARLMAWAGPDTAHNLGLIPEEKLDWKPAPTAKSALEIANHIGGYILSMTPVLGGQEWRWPEFAPATSREEAQSLLTTAAEEYVAALRRVSPDLLRQVVQVPAGAFPLARAAAFPVVDLIHHRGQIIYIQTLLGDAEDHFLFDSA